MEKRPRLSSCLVRAGLFALIALAVLLLIFLLGPREQVDIALRPVDLPQDLDAYLAESEGQFGDIVPGTEKRIVWAGQPGERTDLALIYLHGFSATRQETAPLPEQVATALGANLYETRLAGHGRTGQAMAEVTVNDWLNDANEALAIGRRLGDRIVVLGVSNGGTLAAWLAAEVLPADVAAYVLMSPAFAHRDSTSTILTWPWGEQIARLVIGPERSWEGENADHERYWTNRYPTESIIPFISLVNYVDGLDFATVNTPLLLIYSPDDNVVSPEKMEEVFAAWGTTAKELRPVTNSADPNDHVLAGDILSPGTTDAVAEMILGFIGGIE